MYNSLKMAVYSVPRANYAKLNSPILHKFVKDRKIHLYSCLQECSKTGLPTKNPETCKFKGSENDTWVGPPHELSNLRLKVFPQTTNLSDEEKLFYRKSREIQDWNQMYWEKHNRDFSQSRKEFLEKIIEEKNLPKKEALTSQEMAEFYKNFLNTNHKKHMQYNWDWYKKNITLILLAAKANCAKLIRVLKS